MQIFDSVVFTVSTLISVWDDCTEMGTFKIGLTVVISRGIFYRVAHLFLNSISYEFDRPRDRLLPSTGRTPPKTDKIIGKIRFIICSRTCSGFFRLLEDLQGIFWLLEISILKFSVLFYVQLSIRSVVSYSRKLEEFLVCPLRQNQMPDTLSLFEFVHKIYFYISEFYFFTMEQVDTLNGGGRSGGTTTEDSP